MVVCKGAQVGLIIPFTESETEENALDWWFSKVSVTWYNT